MSSAPFVGRADEIAALERALGEGRRLLTIWGPAGIGKTRLAQRLLERRAADEGWFCDLAAASDASEICAALARDLRVTRDELASVATALVAPGEHVEADELALVLAARGETLVVLDNFEQVSAYAPETLGRFVAAAPQVCFVVTSRERLRLSAEIAFELAPLSLAARDDGDASEAVTLLIERVRAAQPSYQPSADDVASLAEIARVLEGIPLALELAAARVEMLGAAGVLRRLRDEAASTPQLALLSRGRRDAPDRQATLQRAIEWSWSLLGEIERAALAQLSVFRGGFSAAAAEAVLASVATPPSGSTLDVLDVLSSLRDKSLLRARPKESGSSELRLYESVRELAASKLARQGGAAAAETAHADYYLRRAREVLAEVVEIEAFELANLLVVVQRLLAQPLLDAGAADDLLTCLLAVDRARGSSAGHLELLERGIDACRGVEGAAPALRARALRARGKARQLRGRLAGAIDDLEAALSLSREAEQAALEGDVLADIGVVFHQQRAIDKAAARYDEALARYRELGDRRAEARVQANLAALHHDQRRFEEAARDYQRALTIFAEVGDQRLAGVHRTNLGILEQERGELAEAEACFERALAILHSAGEARYEAIARGSLGVLRHEQGRLDDARACHEAALHVLGEVADVKSEALCRCRLAMVCAEADQPQGAADHLQAAEALFSGLGSSVEQAVGALARGFIELGEARRAAAAGDEAEAHAQLSRVRERIGRALAPGAGERSPAELSDDVRSSVRLLERAIARFERGAGAASPTAAAAAAAAATAAARPAPAPSAQAPAGGEGASLRADALVVGPEARWFRPPGGQWQDFRQRRSMRLILLCLVEQHRSAPGRGADVDALLAAGWPGERVHPDAASNRVYVALAGLRKLGLKPYLLRQDDGYLLDPTLAVQWTAREPT